MVATLKKPNQKKVLAKPSPVSNNNPSGKDFASELRTLTVACRVSHSRFGVRKALNRDQTHKAAETFAAQDKTLRASKRLIDTADPAYRAVVRVKQRVNHYWKWCSTPYPEPGIRLIRRQFVEEFNAQMETFRGELEAAVAVLQEKYPDLREKALHELGELYDSSDYPDSITDHFGLDWDFPSIEPPEYLKKLHPHIYEQECTRIRARFEEAIALTEQSFATKFNELVSHLADRLSGDTDGKPKTFRDSAVQNLTSFFDDFRKLDLGSNADLGKLIDQAQKAVAGMTPGELRDNQDARQRVATELAKVTAKLDGMMVARPKRAIRLEDPE